MKQCIQADGELVSYYTAGIGVRAQGYETGGVAFDPRHADDHLVSGLIRARGSSTEERQALTPIEWVDAAAQTLAELPYATRATLERVYSPRGWPNFLAIACAPRWGGGTLVRLAIETPRAKNAYAKAHPGKPADSMQILRYLADEAGRGAETKKYFDRLVEDCEGQRDAALCEYDALRVERIRVASDAWKARQAGNARARAAMLVKELRGQLERDSALFDARLRRDVA